MKIRNHQISIIFLKKVVTIILWILLSIFYSSCKPSLIAGQYQGVFASREKSPQPVSIQVKFDQRDMANVEVRDLSQNLLQSMSLKWSWKSNRLKVTLPRMGKNIQILTPVSLPKGDPKSWKCYQGKLEYKISICFGTDQFVMNVSGLSESLHSWSLSGDLSARVVNQEKEDPNDYKLSDALSRAVGKGFDARMEYQRVVQASEAARVAYFNLLPHVDYKSAMGISTLIPRTIFNFIANFVPFVIPTRWLKVREAADLKHAEELTLNILRADLTYQVETLAYVYERDRTNLNYFKQQLDQVSIALDHVNSFGSQECGVNACMLDELKFRSGILTNFMSQERIRLENAVGLDLTALSLSMGFMSPEAVRSMDIGESEASIESANEITAEQREGIIRTAMARSLELRQMDDLIDNAETQKEEFYFNWADPDVSSQMSVSLSLIPYLARASAVIKELIVRKEHVQAQVAQRATNAILNYNAAIQSYRVAKPEYDIINKHLDDLIADILAGKSSSDIHTNGPNFQWLLNTHIQFRLKLNDTLALFRMARAQLKRALLESYYSRLIDQSGVSVEVSPLERLGVKIDYPQGGRGVVSL